VTYLEKIQTEHVFGTRYDCWNVRPIRSATGLTSPTNLYSKNSSQSDYRPTEFPSRVPGIPHYRSLELVRRSRL